MFSKSNLRKGKAVGILSGAVSSLASVGDSVEMSLAQRTAQS